MNMRTSVDIPDELFRRAKLKAVSEGTTLRDLLVRGLDQVLQTQEPNKQAAFDKVFGLLRDDPEAVAEINRVIEEEFNTIDPEDWK